MNFTNLQIEIWQSTLYIVNNQMSTYVPKNYRLKYDEVWAGKYIINPQMSLLQSYPRLWYSFRKSCWATEFQNNGNGCICVWTNILRSWGSTLKFESIWRGWLWQSGTKGIFQEFTFHLNFKLSFKLNSI